MGAPHGAAREVRLLAVREDRSVSGTVRLARPAGGEEHEGPVLSEIISVRLTAQDVADLNALVREEQREASELIRMALRAFIVERLGRVA